MIIRRTPAAALAVAIAAILGQAPAFAAAPLAKTLSLIHI